MNRVMSFVSLQRVGWFAALLAYTVFLLWFATRPQSGLLWVEIFWDKLRHAAAFFVMGILVLGAAGFPALSARKCARRGAWGVLYALLVGILMEVMQSHAPGRFAERADVVADVVGAAAAVLGAVIFLRRRERLIRAAYP